MRIFLVLLLIVSPLYAETQEQRYQREFTEDYQKEVRANSVVKRMFWVCAGLDVATTVYGLNNGFSEANPILKPLMDRGTASTKNVAVLSLFSVGQYLLLLRSKNKERENLGFTVVNVAHCTAAALNTYTLSK